MFWKTASAVPSYQLSLTRPWAEREMMKSPLSAWKMFQPLVMWRSRERDLYWVSRAIRRSPELRALDRLKSTMR